MNKTAARGRVRGATALPVAATLLLGLAGSTLTLAPSGYVAAQTAPAADQRQGLADIVALVQAAGYPEVLEVELEGSRYHVEARDGAGRSIELRLDAASGVVVAGPSHDEVERIAATVRAAGHGEILEVEDSDGRYEVLAVDGAGREVELKLDAVTLEVLAFERDDDDDESDESDDD